jgi:hypothetical protein
MKKAGTSSIEAIATTAAAVRAVVRKSVTKGELSGAVTKRIPDGYSYPCRGCGTTHVHEQLLRMSALPGGVRIEGSSPLTFVPIAKRRAIPRKPVGVERLVTAYLTLHGPATPADAGGFLGTSGPHVRPAWPDGLAEVTVEGRKSWLPEEAVDVLRSAEPLAGVLLLPPFDPFLQARDRDLLVPSKARAKKVWTVLGNPGVLLVDGDVAGTWRAKQGGKGRLDVTVTAFGTLPKERYAEVEAETARVAALRGLDDVRVTYA